ncbi:MAG: DnaJ domain-containing protein [Elusimicrobiota bacterium]
MNRPLLILLAGFIYVVMPFDGDFLGVVGWIDDIFVAVLAIYLAVEALRKQVRTGPGGRRAQAPAAPPEEELPRDPYKLLGVSPDAAAQDIKEAYRREMAKYHPDKVQHLGAEFRRLAEQKAKAIQKAYAQLTS